MVLHKMVTIHIR